MTAATVIPPVQFGKDHYSTLAYIETRIMDHRGRLHHEHMRCDYWRHRVLYEEKRNTIARGEMAGMVTRTETGRLVFAGPMKRYPTFLAGGVEQDHHDDYDCLLDLIAAGWLTADTDDPLDPEAAYTLTPTGRTVANALREHKGNGGKWATFTAPEETL